MDVELMVAVEQLRVRMLDIDAVERYERKLDQQAMYARDYNKWVIKQLQGRTIKHGSSTHITCCSRR